MFVGEVEYRFYFGAQGVERRIHVADLDVTVQSVLKFLEEAGVAVDKSAHGERIAAFVEHFGKRTEVLGVIVEHVFRDV